MSLARLRHTGRTLAHRLAIRRETWPDRTLWALDLETGGLDPRTDPILSVGMIPIRHGVIRLGDAFHSLLRAERPMNESSLMVHHIRPGEIAGAPAPEVVLREVAERLRGGVLIVHQRSVDVPFLAHAFRAHQIAPPVIAVIDTVELLLRYARRHGHLTQERTEFPTGLGDARARFGLPTHRSHEALSDAVATAELFLVLAHRLDAVRVGQLL